MTKRGARTSKSEPGRDRPSHAPASSALLSSVQRAARRSEPPSAAEEASLLGQDEREAQLMAQFFSWPPPPPAPFVPPRFERRPLTREARRAMWVSLLMLFGVGPAIAGIAVYQHVAMPQPVELGQWSDADASLGLQPTEEVAVPFTPRSVYSASLQAPAEDADPASEIEEVPAEAVPSDESPMEAAPDDESPTEAAPTDKPASLEGSTGGADLMHSSTSPTGLTEETAPATQTPDASDALEIPSSAADLPRVDEPPQGAPATPEPEAREPAITTNTPTSSSTGPVSDRTVGELKATSSPETPPATADAVNGSRPVKPEARPDPPQPRVSRPPLPGPVVRIVPAPAPTSEASRR